MGGCPIPRIRLTSAWPAAAALAALAASFVGLAGCDGNPVSGAYQTARDECLVPCNELISTSQGKDGIPALTNPFLVSSTAALGQTVLGSDRVLAVEIPRPGATPFYGAYPLKVLRYHGIVGDTNFHTPLNFLVTFDPLTRFGSCNDVSAYQTSFGTAGLVYNCGQLLYDRLYAGTWSPILAKALKGVQKGQTMGVGAVIETRWEFFLGMHPDAVTLSTYTGYGFDYSVNPQAQYEASNNLTYPVNHVDTRLPNKERVFGFHPGGVLGDSVNRVYRLANLAVNPVVNDTVFDGVRQAAHDVLVLYDPASETAQAFYRPQVPSGTASSCGTGSGTLCFSADPAPAPFGIYLRDAQTNSVWDSGGRAIAGALTGQTMTRVESFSGAYWFAWAAYFHDPPAEIR